MSYEQLKRRLSKAGLLLTSPRRVATNLRDVLHREFLLRHGPRPLPEIRLGQILEHTPTVRLESLQFREGNVSPGEILAIAAIVADRKPSCILEIGTFDGNTTLQIAANAPSGAKVYTLDLPLDPPSVTKRVEAADTQFIDSDARAHRRYIGTSFERNIIQLEGDSASFNFEQALNGIKPELIFVDGSHSYEYVRTDTETALRLLAPGGTILWHDYTDAWPGVPLYLGQLQETLPVKRLAGTTLAHYRKPTGA